MKLTHKLAAGFLAAASTFSALAADAAPAPAVTFNGYAVMTGSATKESGAATSSSLDLTAAKFGVTGKFGTVTGYASLYYSGAKTDLLDAYFTVDAGSGLSITGGKFLSYMGYEAFDPINMDQISYANGDLLGGPVPAYHTGVKFDVTKGDSSFGAALVDSIYSVGGPFKGDGDFKKPGIEAYYTYKGIKDVQLWFGGLQDTDGNGAVYDFWATYAVNKTDTIGVEYLKKESDGYNWLLSYKTPLSAKVTLTSRISGESSSVADAKFTKFTLSPAYTVNDNLTVRAEVSYYDYSGAGAPTSSKTFFAVQSLLKF
jgi:hypothetical protein